MKSQKQRILNYLNDYGSITSYQAYLDLGITQLATRIKELKEQGYLFKTEWEYQKNRYGKKIKFIKYSLEEEENVYKKN